MVERLKQAIEKARQQREGDVAPGDVHVTRPPPVADGRDAAWAALPEVTFDPKALGRHRLQHPSRGAHPTIQVPIDILRTRLRKVCVDNGWSRIGITSPNKGCGKSFVTANLAFSLSRNFGSLVLLADFDLKKPQLANMLGVKPAHSVHEMLDATVAPSDVLMRHGTNLALALQGNPIRYSAELFQASSTASAMTALSREFAPDMLLFDLPPLFVSDDVLGFLPHLDAIILVAAAGQTTAAEVTECEDIMGNSTSFLGVVLNKVDGDEVEDYEGTYAALDVAG